MHTSLGRPLIAKHLIKIAHEEGADAISHGCTGKGNDQCRFEFTAFALDPAIRTIAPVREWELKTRDDEIEYARKWKIPVPVTKKKPYSIDKNLFGCAIECGALEDLQNEPPEDAWQDLRSPLKAPNKPEDVAIAFEKGVPVALNGRKMSPLAVIQKLAAIGNRHGVGRLDMVENRLVGIKSREVYEAPASTILITAHKELESLCLDRDTARFKELVSQRFTDIIYNGLWFSPLRKALQAFTTRTQETVTGEIVIRLYKGSAFPVRRSSPYSLYDKSLATYEAGDQFRHESALGFIDIYGLPLRIHAAVARRAKGGRRGRESAKK
jgi:argininosuccinate synthase